jgi:hypothetical protein
MRETVFYDKLFHFIEEILYKITDSPDVIKLLDETTGNKPKL